jgi:hypothetical protein
MIQKKMTTRAHFSQPIRNDSPVRIAENMVKASKMTI